MKCLNETWPCQNRRCHHHIHAYDLGLNSKKYKETDKSLEIGNCCKKICSEWTLEEIAECWGLTRERIRQIEEKGLDRLTLSTKADLFAGDYDLLKQLTKRRKEIKLRKKEQREKDEIYKRKEKERKIREKEEVSHDTIL